VKQAGPRPETHRANPPGRDPRALDRAQRAPINRAQPVPVIRDPRAIDVSSRTPAGESYPTSDRHRPDIRSTSDRHQIDIRSTSDRHRPDIRSTSDRHRPDIRSTPARHQIDTGPTSDRHRPDIKTRVAGPRSAARDPCKLLGSLRYRVKNHRFCAEKPARNPRPGVCVPRAWAMFLTNIH